MGSPPAIQSIFSDYHGKYLSCRTKPNLCYRFVRCCVSVRVLRTACCGSMCNHLRDRLCVWGVHVGQSQFLDFSLTSLCCGGSFDTPLILAVLFGLSTIITLLFMKLCGSSLVLRHRGLNIDVELYRLPHIARCTNLTNPVGGG